MFRRKCKCVSFCVLKTKRKLFGFLSSTMMQFFKSHSSYFPWLRVAVVQIHFCFCNDAPEGRLGTSASLEERRVWRAWQCSNHSNQHYSFTISLDSDALTKHVSELSRQIWMQDGHSDLPLARRPQPADPLNVTGACASPLKLWQA